MFACELAEGWREENSEKKTFGFCLETLNKYLHRLNFQPSLKTPLKRYLLHLLARLVLRSLNFPKMLSEQLQQSLVNDANKIINSTVQPEDQ